VKCKKDPLPYISVIVPTLNSGKTIEKCLVSILNQEYPKDRFEVIIIDGGSQDKTIEISREYPVKIIREFRKGRGIAYNLGLKEAKGDIVAFVDSDAYTKTCWLEEMEKEMTKNAEMVAVYCRLKAPNDSKFLQKCVDTVNFTGKGQSNGVIYRRNILLKEGGFNEKMDYLQENELEFRLLKEGYIIHTIEKILIYHYPRNSIKGYLEQNKEAGRGVIFLYFSIKKKKIILEILFRITSMLYPLFFLVELKYSTFFALFLAAIYVLYVARKTHPDYRKPKYLLSAPFITYISLVGNTIGYGKALFTSKGNHKEK